MIISEMQRKLATWAATDPSLRIQRLLRLITQPEWLAEAARITLSSKGAHTPGVDGVNKTMLQARLAVELQILRDELLSGHYQPLPARRVYIPKSNGKLRLLSKKFAYIRRYSLCGGTRFCFSKMTFPHQLMRVILLEQIYRSYRIMTNQPYHK